MDALTFTVEMTKALAWPVSIAIIAVVYRSQIHDLLNRMRKGKFGPAEFEFEDKIRDIAANSPDVVGNIRSSGGPSISRIEAEPRAVILEQWLFVEDDLRKRSLAEGLSEAADMPSHVLVKKLEAMGKLNPLAGPLFRDMRHLRNSAAHSVEFEPDPEAVKIYINMTTKLRELIQGPNSAA